MRPWTIIRVVANSHIFGSNPAFISFVNVASDNSCQESGIYLHLYKFIFTRHNLPVHFDKFLVRLFSSVKERQKTNIHSRALKERFSLVVIVGLNKGSSLLAHPVTG